MAGTVRHSAHGTCDHGSGVTVVLYVCQRGCMCRGEREKEREKGGGERERNAQ